MVRVGAVMTPTPRWMSSFGCRGAWRRARGVRALPCHPHRAAPTPSLRRWFDSELAQDPFCVDLASWLDDPRAHQVAKHVVALGGQPEPQHPVGRTESIPQVGHLRRRDRQRIRSGWTCHAEVQHSLAGSRQVWRGSASAPRRWGWSAAEYGCGRHRRSVWPPG